MCTCEPGALCDHHQRQQAYKERVRAAFASPGATFDPARVVVDQVRADARAWQAARLDSGRWVRAGAMEVRLS